MFVKKNDEIELIDVVNCSRINYQAMLHKCEKIQLSKNRNLFSISCFIKLMTYFRQFCEVYVNPMRKGLTGNVIIPSCDPISSHERRYFICAGHISPLTRSPLQNCRAANPGKC